MSTEHFCYPQKVLITLHSLFFLPPVLGKPWSALHCYNLSFLEFHIYVVMVSRVWLYNIFEIYSCQQFLFLCVNISQCIHLYVDIWLVCSFLLKQVIVNTFVQEFLLPSSVWLGSNSWSVWWLCSVFFTCEPPGEMPMCLMLRFCLFSTSSSIMNSSCLHRCNFSLNSLG